MRMVVVGAGRWGSLHCEKVAKEAPFELIGVVDADGAKAARVAKRFRAKSYERLIDCEPFDAAIIATPIESLLRLGKEATEYNVPILIEKPVSVDASAMKQFYSSVRKQGRSVKVGYQMRFHNGLSALPRNADLFFTRTETGFFDLWSMIIDCGVHDIELALHLLGEMPEIVKVERSASSFTVHGRVREGRTVHWHWALGQMTCRRLQSGREEIDFLTPCIDMLQSQLANFYCGEGGDTPICADLKDACRVVELLDEIQGRLFNG